MADEMDRLWGLILELSAQLTQNRAQCDALRQQADSLKQQAVHVGSGFTLRRFNVDISKEVFESEVERLNATLVCENHGLQHENKHLTMLLKDYESTVENLMGRFRSFAHSTQMHELSMTRHYEALLTAKPDPSPVDGHSYRAIEQQASLPEPDLSHLSGLLIKALRSMQGEDPSPPGTPTEGDISKGGGYLALLGSLTDGRDEALETEIEHERLTKENAELRAMLGIAEELPPAPEHTEPFIKPSAPSPSLAGTSSPPPMSVESLAPTVPPPEGTTDQLTPNLDTESAIAD